MRKDSPLLGRLLFRVGKRGFGRAEIPGKIFDKLTVDTTKSSEIAGSQTIHDKRSGVLKYHFGVLKTLVNHRFTGFNRFLVA